MNKEFQESKELKELIIRIIKDENLVHLNNVDIASLLVYPNISKSIVGKCIRSSKELKYFSKKDFIIEMSGEVWDALDDSVKYILVLHELLHIMVVTDKKGNLQYKIHDHDVKDFSKIIKKYGIEWFDKIKASVSSLYDLEPSEEETITI